MKQFDINEIIRYYQLDTESLAPVLFPTVKYPKLALDRVLKGQTNLDISQVELLAEHIGVLVSDLFSINKWKGSTEGTYLTLIKGDYKVKLNYKGVFISVYKNNALIFQEISDVPGMTMNEFTNHIDNIIKSYENGNN